MLGIRIGINKRGCNGLRYTMKYITPDNSKLVEKDDVIITENNVKVFVEARAIINIVGTTLDFVENEMSSEFTFVNPKSTGSCGCGESFTV